METQQPKRGRGKPEGSKDAVNIKLEELNKLFMPNFTIRVNRKWLETITNQQVTNFVAPIESAAPKVEKVQIEVVDFSKE